MEEYIANGAAVPWRTFQVGEDKQLKVRVLLGGIKDGPEAVHSAHAPGEVRPHFHLGSQFQLVLSGAVDFPGQHLDAIAVHYTDHNVPYGPFVIGDNYQMMVVHARPAGQIDVDPSNRELRKLINGTGREIHRSSSEVEWEPLPGHASARHKRLIDEPSGLRAWVIEADPGAEVRLEPAPYGQFNVVARGSATMGGQTITNYGVRFVRGAEPPGPIVCGREGATLVVLAYDEDAAQSYGGDIYDRLKALEARSRELVG